MAFKDLRQYIQRLEEEGELNRTEAEVDWNLEVGAISRRAIDRRSGALLFDKIKGYPPGYRIMANSLGPGRPIHALLSLAFGQPKETPPLRLADWFGRRVNESIPPRTVAWAPCKENVLRGQDANLLSFPFPKIHGIDGGRYAAWHVDITRDPDTGWVNWGVYRQIVHDEKRLGFKATPTQHGPGMYYQKYEARGEAMPMAIAIGTDPVCAIAASAALPAQVNEADVAGALQGEPVELVRCETIDLEVPASAEIVLEGHVVPRERASEGPFGEFTGYAAGSESDQPVFYVDCITHRNDPILTMSNMGKPWDELGIMSSVVASALVSEVLRKQGIPFKAVYCPPPSLALIIAAKPQYAGFVHSVASAIWGSKAGIHRPYVFMVGEDVDVTNMDEVFWCLTSRLHPSRGIHIQNDAPGQPLFPFLDRGERNSKRGARVAFDATFPPYWPPDDVPTIMDFEHGWPKEVQEMVVERWGEYGIR